MHPYLIIGQGLAGSLLAWRLQEAGVPVEIADAGDPNAASRVAPGIVNPLAGARLKPSWRVAEQIPAVQQLYPAIEAALGGETYFHPTPIVRVVKDARQREYFEQRRKEPAALPYIGEELPPGSLGVHIDDHFGSFVAQDSSWLDAAGLLHALRQHWQEQGILHGEALDYADLHLNDNGLLWRGRQYATAIFCEGWRATQNPFFNNIPWKPARGEMLALDLLSEPFLPGKLASCILNRSKWLLPLADGTYRAGASYAWDEFEAPPTQEKRDEILNVLGEYVDARFRVLGQVCGVRPIVDDYRPVCGRHPEHPQLAILNGLGSKGVMIGPWLSNEVAQHLLEGKALPEEVQLARFWR